MIRTKFVVISDFIKLIKTQDLARVFFAAGRKKKNNNQKTKMSKSLRDGVIVVPLLI